MHLNESMIPIITSSLYSGVLSDVLDEMGNFEHSMRPGIRPLDEGLVMFGRARTGQYMEVFHLDQSTNPYEKEIELIDDLKPNDIAVLGCPKGDRVAPWGELLSTAARARGAVGCVTDGLVRDVRFIREMKFPVFAGGIGPLDSKGRGKVMQTDVPVECGGVRVQPGDWIFGDVDGVVVLPRDNAAQVIDLALERIGRETTVRDELARGDRLADVFARHGVL